MSSEWPPTKLIALQYEANTSMQVVRYLSDVGEVWVKRSDNPFGPHALIREWLCAELADRIGLKTPRHAILDLEASSDVVRDASPSVFQSGARFAFVSEDIDKGLPFALNSAKDLKEAKQAAQLVVFDTWIRNGDRYCNGDVQSENNRANLLVTRLPETQKRLLWAIDHGHALPAPSFGSTLKPSALVNDAAIRDANIYGNWPELKSGVTQGDLVACLDKIAAVTEAEIASLLEGIPEEWKCDKEVGAALGEFLTKRAQFLKTEGRKAFWRYYWPDELLF